MNEERAQTFVEKTRKRKQSFLETAQNANDQSRPVYACTNKSVMQDTVCM